MYLPRNSPGSGRGDQTLDFGCFMRGLAFVVEANADRLSGHLCLICGGPVLLPWTPSGFP